MATIARSEQEIRDAFDANILAYDESIDTTKGPIPFAIRNPVAAVVVSSEVKAQRIDRLYSTAFVSESTDEDFQAIQDNFAIGDLPGTTSQGQVTFHSSTKPQDDEDHFAQAGTIVATRSGRLKYVTEEDALIPGGASEAYYVASSRRWEVTVKATAIGLGDGFDVPAFRINTIQTSVDGFSGVVNKKKFRRGSPGASKEQIYLQIQNALVAGKDLGTIAGQRQTISASTSDTLIANSDEVNQIIRGISVITPADGVSFPRSLNGAALDLVMLLQEDAYLDDGEDEIFASAGQVEFLLSKPPVRTILVVKHNNVVLSPSKWSLETDQSIELKHSGQANDKMVLNGVVPAQDDAILIQYEYNAVIADLEASNIEGANLFGTNILHREPNPVSIEVVVEITPLSAGGDDSDLRDQTQDAILVALTEGLNARYTPEEVRVEVEESISVSSMVRITKLRRSDEWVKDVEVIQLAKNESAVLVFDPDTDIIIRR